MVATYLLLPDGRQEHKDWWPQAQDEIRRHNVAAVNDGWQPYFRPVSSLGPIRAWVSTGPMDPDAMLALLRQIDWAYPAKLLYRTESENGWSFVTLGLSLREESAS